MFDMLLESGHRPSLLPSWGKGVALTLHVAVIGALWRTPAAPATQPTQIIDVFPAEPVSDPGPTPPLPPLPPSCDGCQTIDAPPIRIPGLPRENPNTPISETGGAPLFPGSPLLGSQTDVYPESLVQEAPELLSAPVPAYPPLLRAAGVQGRVIVAAIVDTLGQAENGSVRIVLSDNPGFDAAALATVGAARFRPARIYGRAVRVLVQVPVVFRLN